MIDTNASSMINTTHTMINTIRFLFTIPHTLLQHISLGIALATGVGFVYARVYFIGEVFEILYLVEVCVFF